MKLVSYEKHRKHRVCNVRVVHTPQQEIEARSADEIEDATSFYRTRAKQCRSGIWYKGRWNCLI